MRKTTATVAESSNPPGSADGCTLGELVDLVRAARDEDDAGFADDLEEIQRSQPRMGSLPELESRKTLPHP